MVGARAREIYDMQAKERQKLHGSTAPGKGKSLGVKVREVNLDGSGRASELVGRKVGVCRSLIDRATTAAAARLLALLRRLRCVNHFRR